jgi:hypothetical protein
MVAFTIRQPSMAKPRSSLNAGFIRVAKAGLSCFAGTTRKALVDRQMGWIPNPRYLQGFAGRPDLPVTMAGLGQHVEILAAQSDCRLLSSLTIDSDEGVSRFTRLYIEHRMPPGGLSPS